MKKDDIICRKRWIKSDSYLGREYIIFFIDKSVISENDRKEYAVYYQMPR